MCEPITAPHDPKAPRWSLRPRWLVTWQRNPLDGSGYRTWPVVDTAIYRSRAKAVRQCRRFDTMWGYRVTVSLLP